MNTLALLNHLHRSGGDHGRTRSGVSIINVIVIIAFTLSSTIAFSLVSGTWMFYQRAEDPFGHVAALQESSQDVYNLLYMWVGLALFACLVLIPALQSLTNQAAVVGTTGREQRLAVLRLIGVSSKQVTRMTVLETAVYCLVGITVGMFAYFLLLPALTRVEFQGEKIRLEEVVLPWWGYLAVAGVILFIAVTSTWFAMGRIRVDPLGVAKRAMPPALRIWQALIGLAVAVGVYIFLQSFTMSLELSTAIGILVTVFVMLAFVYLIGPFALQFSARIAARFPGTAHYVATQRVLTNPKIAWRRVAVAAFLSWIIGFLVISPVGDTNTWNERSFNLLISDIGTGIVLTLGFGYALMAISLFLGQATAVYENAELTRSLHLVGVNRWFLTRVALWEVLGPTLLVSLLGFASSSLTALGVFGSGSHTEAGGRLLMAGALVGLGWVLTFAAIVAVEPLRSQVFTRLNSDELG
ncbi:FtsX-like permease family protein [Corynebacterium cystitidis]|uniref:FtsX-like permease family protein n=1 Tax=Corynebacterium cystitidis TaxID=35757 RepID=UPI00211DEF60|nr:FtsX-like permease family protein [Corynebacterium cystitidis]